MNFRDQQEKKSGYEEEKENYRMMERSYGGFQRSLRVPDTVDEDKVAARFENGILRVDFCRNVPSLRVRGARSRFGKASPDQPTRV